MTNTTSALNVSVETTENGSGYSPNANFEDYDTYIMKETTRVLEIIFLVAVNAPISVLGSAANVINIIIFLKQGFIDPVNISLCGLAVSDLCSLLTLVWMSICYNPLLQHPHIEVDTIQVQYITAAWPHGCFVWITSWITAFITFERCVCIALPMKVKDIITPRRTVISVVVIFLTMFASVAPVYCGISIGPTFNVQQNRTMYGLVYSSNAEKLENISSSITVASQISCLIIVIVCTVALIHNLRSKSQWRSTVTSYAHSSSSDSLSKRDKRVIKMITIISGIFIVCNFPSAVTLTLMVHISPDYSKIMYQHYFKMAWAILYTIEAGNSCVTIIVYYNMSSKFRATFSDLFGLGTSNVKEI